MGYRSFLPYLISPEDLVKFVTLMEDTFYGGGGEGCLSPAAEQLGTDRRLNTLNLGKQVGFPRSVLPPHTSAAQGS